MKQRHQVKWILALAIGTLPTLWIGHSAWAQYPAAGQDGHANDANNRIGSNGYNSGSGQHVTVTGNQIVTGNVTGGRAFRGPVPYTDPSGFMGPMGDAVSDAFIRNSSGVPSRFGAPADLTTPRPFYGDVRAVPPPAGSVPEGFNGGYVGTSLTSPSSLTSVLSSAPLDYSLQARTMPQFSPAEDVMSNPYSFQNSLPQPGESSLLTGSSLIASPLFGVRAQNGSMMNAATGNQYQPGANSIEAMQREMIQASGPRQQQAQPNANAGPGNSKTGNTGSLVQPLDHPLEAPQNNPLSNDVTSNPLENGPLNSSVTTGQGLRQQFIVPPSRQSTQYSELDKRLQQYNASHPVTDEQANAQFQQELANRQRQANSTITGGNAERQGTKCNGNAPAGNAPSPLEMDSLATGIPAKGLHDLMANAEVLLREDRFTTAIEQYDRAARVAPNNPLIPMGRAIAELGAGLYAQSERDLRQVYRSAPATMMAKVNLGHLLTSQRLEYLSKDLSSLAQQYPHDERPWFLLAFIHYNTGHSDEAAKDLNNASERGGKLDSTIKMLQSHWKISSDSSNQRQEPAAKPSPKAPTTRPEAPADLNK